MKHDRMQPSVGFEMLERGFLLSVNHGMGMMGTRYAFDRIEDVAAWFIDQYAAQGIEAPTGGETGNTGSTEGESPVA